MRGKIFIFILIFLSILVIIPYLYAELDIEADYGQISETKKNILGGYDYYDTNNIFRGYSVKTPSGYKYYDSQGNYLGEIKRYGEKYYIYNAEGVKIGSIKKLPSKKYRVKSNFQDTFKEIEPLPNEDIPSLNIWDILLQKK